MTAFTVPDPDTGRAPACESLREVRTAWGVLPKLARVISNSQAMLRDYLELNTALSAGVFAVRMREHGAQLPAIDIHLARRATSCDVRVRALLLIPSAGKRWPRRRQRGRTEHSPLHRAYRRRARRADRAGRAVRADQHLRGGGRVRVNFPLVTRADAA
jgi:hypothetical protein